MKLKLITKRLHIRLKLVLFAFILLGTFQANASVSVASPLAFAKREASLASRSMSLTNRQPDTWVNEVFADNILLNLSYMRGKTAPGQTIDWNEVRKPFEYSFTLEPHEVFAYHEDTLPTYPLVKQTTNAHFNGTEGFKSDGYLIGDGVCHLASLFYWAASDAGLDAYAPTNHSFAQIMDVPAEYGVSIFYYPGNYSANAQQNLYIRNNKDKPVRFEISFDGEKVTVSIIENIN